MMMNPTSSGGIISWLGIGPGNVKIDHVKALINEIMAVSTLLSGFSIGLSAKITDKAIHSYATFLKREFFGKHSHYCSFEVKHKLLGFRMLSSLPSYDVAHPDQANADNAHCSSDGCWVGHWQTITAATELGFEPCSLSVDEVQATYPDYFDRIVEEKAADVQIELGRNTMLIIFTTVAVVSLGSLLRLSIIKRYDSPEAWLKRFYPLVVILAMLPLFNFYNFLMLASRVMRVLWYYCDDYITTACMVTNTPGFDHFQSLLLAAGALVWVLHLSMPRSPTPARAEPTQGSGAPVGFEVRLESLIKMRDAGDLTFAEFNAGKAKLWHDCCMPDLAVQPELSVGACGAGAAQQAQATASVTASYAN